MNIYQIKSVIYSFDFANNFGWIYHSISLVNKKIVLPKCVCYVPKTYHALQPFYNHLNRPTETAICNVIDKIKTTDSVNLDETQVQLTEELKLYVHIQRRLFILDE